jgi:glutaredoxin
MQPHAGEVMAVRAPATVVLMMSLLQTFCAPAQAQTPDVAVHLFWQRGCPHCERAIEYLTELEARDAGVDVRYLELGSSENRRAYRAVVEQLGLRRLSVPLTVIGETAIEGFLDAATTGRMIEERVAGCRRSACASAVARMQGERPPIDDRALALAEIDRADEIAEAAHPAAGSEPAGEGAVRFEVPWLGEIDLRTLSLPALTVLLGAADGFNPCAMWVLVFLIGLLLGLQDPTRRWLLGAVFLLTTAVVYYMMIAAWLGALLVLGLVTWLRVAVGLLALAGGTYYVYGALRNPEIVCRLAKDARRQKVLARLRAAVTEPRFVVATGAIVVLAAGVNLIELLCSAGIPAVYSQVLALTPMPPWQYYAWLALYVLVFIADDLAIFVTAMVTLEASGAANRYAHHAQLVGGVALVAIGALLVLRPDWLLFG